jgi:hypothetical protein
VGVEVEVSHRHLYHPQKNHLPHYVLEVFV